MIALDTNVLARYYVASSDAASIQQSAAAKKLLESGQALFVSKSVLLELEWVLRGYYKSPPKDVLAVLEHVLAVSHVALEDRVAVEWATAALRDGFDFADALHHASARHCTSMATFDDKKFARRATAKGWKPSVKLLAS
jgi:predicted nucleic-acid-binding protein